MKRLPRSFYTRNTITVAKDLLGKTFVRSIGRTILLGTIVETEAYLFNDPASHSFRGMTERNSVMFRKGGLLYIYFTYGMHYCANVVTNKEEIGEAVLIRAVEPIEGFRSMAKNRGIKNDHSKNGNLPSQRLTNGPAKFAQAFALTKKDSGNDLVHGNIFITHGRVIRPSMIVAATRIGISRAKEQKWRFYIKGNMWVSKA